MPIAEMEIGDERSVEKGTNAICVVGVGVAAKGPEDRPSNSPLLRSFRRRFPEIARSYGASDDRICHVTAPMHRSYGASADVYTFGDVFYTMYSGGERSGGPTEQ